jgi:hypothetical protein
MEKAGSISGESSGEAVGKHLRQAHFVMPKSAYDEIQRLAEQNQTSVASRLRKYVELGIMADRMALGDQEAVPLEEVFEELYPHLRGDIDKVHVQEGIRIRITEDPLTAHNLTTIISALTELSTKYWLIAKGRFADLIEYTQTRNVRFAEEAHTVIARIRYNSPFNMDWRVEMSAPSVAEAIVTTIDGIAQIRLRLEKAQLETQAKAQEIEQASQKADQEQQMALIEQQKQELEVERQRLELLEKRLEVQKKGIEYALEIASKVVDILHADADLATRAMEIQVLLPNLIQLQSGVGLELALLAPPKRTKKRR